MGKEEKKNPGGRPPKILNDEDWKKVNSFLQAQCEGSKIARYFGMSPDTLYDKVVEKYGEEYGISTFSAYADIKRGEGVELLRRKQFDKAMGGDSTMLIWLGKQILGQKDTKELTGNLNVTGFEKLMMEATAELDGE